MTRTTITKQMSTCLKILTHTSKMYLVHNWSCISGMLKNNPQELLYIKRLLIALEILYNWVISNKSLYIFDIQAIVYFSMGSKLPVILYCL